MNASYLWHRETLSTRKESSLDTYVVSLTQKDLVKGNRKSNAKKNRSVAKYHAIIQRLALYSVRKN